MGDASGTLTPTVDLLGRVMSTRDDYGDANAAADHATRLTYGQAGHLVRSHGPGGCLDTDSGGRVTRQRVGTPAT